MAKGQEGQAQWGDPAPCQGPLVGLGERLLGVQQGQLLLGVGQPRLLLGLPPGERPQGHRPDGDKMAETKMRREPRRLTQEQKERLKDPKFVLALKAVKPLVLEERRRQGVRRRTTR